MRPHRDEFPTRLAVLVLCAVATSAAPAAAALLRPFNQITGPIVHLADLFEDLGATPDRALGRAPQPGERIVVRAPQLAAIARDFDVDWRPATGGEQAVVERRGDVLPRETILSAIRAALLDAGAPPDMEIATPDLQDIVVPAGSHVQPGISQLNYDDRSGRFSALLSVAMGDMPAVQVRMSGAVFAMVQATIAVRRLAAGAEVGADDVRQMHVRAVLLRGAAPLLPAGAIGLTARRGIVPGQPLSLADLAKTPLVLRGDHVRMSLVSDGLSLSAQGIATEAGGRGDRIHVENPVSHLLVDAAVTGPDEVRVSPQPAAISLAAAR